MRNHRAQTSEHRGGNGSAPGIAERDAGPNARVDENPTAVAASFSCMVTRTLLLARQARAAAALALHFAGGSQLPVPAQAPQGGQPPVLTAFSINGGGDTVSINAAGVALVHTVVGTRPSDYRVSHRADFLGARWEHYAETPILRDWNGPNGGKCDATRASHRVTLYFQVRATVGEEVRVVDGQRQLQPARVESNVLKASICARADRSPS